MTDDLPETSNLAFEDGIPHDTPTQSLWCVRAWRIWHDQRARHSNWFASESAAWDHAKRLIDRGDEVIGVYRYELQVNP